ncbi:transposase family protein [Streptomyces sp. NBC_00224]|uniref:Transposase family protein n=1 Tax=Streptomyces sp. NBC_00060 TaxID=2975636 RepID=A0AAU2GQE2_9ACTN
MADGLDALPDPRDRRGRRHSLASVLLLAACAVLTGPAPTLPSASGTAPLRATHRLSGSRRVGVLGVRTAATTSTIRRVLLAVCPGGLADRLGCAPAGVESLALGVKSACGSRTVDVVAAHPCPQSPGAHAASPSCGSRTGLFLSTPDQRFGRGCGGRCPLYG